MIRLKNVSKYYYSKGVIATGFTKINLEFKLGEFVAITGESGSGKSTLLNVISGLETYEEGEMYINGEETSHYISKDWEDYRRKNIGNIYQNFNLINSYTVYQNIELVLILNGVSKKDAKNKILELIKSVGLYKFRNTKVSKLSGGQKQRVAIARALAKDTPVIIADEPTGNLDKKSATEIVALLSEIAKDKLVIIVTHNYEQVEKYATRKITMHDGKILEDKKLRQIEFVEDKKISYYKNLSFINKLKLGFRNTFNVLPKFILLFFVYLFIVVALMSEYSTFKKEEVEAEKSGYNYVFRDTSDNRIIVRKNDKTAFTTDELAKLMKEENVDYIFEHDTLADEFVQLADKNRELWINGFVSSNKNFKEKVDVGRLPKQSNEIIIKGSKSDYYLGQKVEKILNQEFYFENDQTGELNKEFTIKVVGVKYLSSNDYSDFTLYLSDEILNKLHFKLLQRNSTVTINFMNKNYQSTYYQNDFQLRVNDNVPVGKAYISEDFDVYCDKGKCLNKTFNIEATNIYYTDTKTLTIDKIYNKNNFNKLLNISNYKKENYSDFYNGVIYINNEDYNSLFNKGNYQISIYAKDFEKIDATTKKLNKLGYTTLALKDTLVASGAKEMMRILKTIITIILVITLFFICYFIIKIILKSRNIYFSIIRMLGGTKKVAKDLLVIELLVVSNIAYFIFLLIVYLNKLGLFTINFITTINEYFIFNDYIFLYVIISLMSYLISQKYARKLFKDSVMNTYREEI